MASGVAIACEMTWSQRTKMDWNSVVSVPLRSRASPLVMDFLLKSKTSSLSSFRIFSVFSHLA